MSETQDDRLTESVESSVDNLDAASIVAYLRDNPDFFVTHADLLTELLLPHESGEAVSLVERQVSVLRDRNMENRKHIGRLLDAAKNNDALFARTRALILALLDATDLPTLVRSLVTEMRTQFGVDEVSIFAFDGTLKPVLGIRSSTRAHAKEVLGKLLEGAVTCGAIREQEATFLFPEHPAMRSAAVVPLRHREFRGMLALGSSDADKFDPRMETLFVRYIGEVLCRLLVGNR